MSKSNHNIRQGDCNRWKKLLAYSLCGIITFSAFHSHPILAKDLEGSRNASTSLNLSLIHI